MQTRDDAVGAAINKSNSPLSVNRLNAYYGKAQVLFDVTFDIVPNEVTALLGRNGAGKSTLFKSLVGAPGIQKTGTVLLDGSDITDAPPHANAARGLILVPEDRRIFASLSVRDNLRLGRIAAETRHRVARDTSAIVAHLPKLNELLDRGGAELSGGEQQMVAIGRALAGQPSVLLMDEPSTGLAPVVLDELKDAIKSLARSNTVTVLMSEQNAAFALRICSRVIVIDRGRIVFTGTKEEFTDRPDLSTTYLSV